MLVKYHVPNRFLSPKILDVFLATGWFRSAYMMYRAKMVCLDEELNTIINIRTNLCEYAPSKSLRKLLRRNDEQFRTVIRPMYIDADKQRLYTMQQDRFGGFIYSDLKYFFYGEDAIRAPFNTQEVCVYDGDRLVAASFFDLGGQSMASLLAIYDTAYAKASLGIYTMLKEVEYAQSLGLKYYYPGYILDKNPAFDYKLRLGQVQYFNWETSRWRKWQSRKDIPTGADAYLDHLTQVQTLLEAQGIAARLYLNPYFSIGYINHDYVRGAAFLACYETEGIPQYIVEYWPEEEQYILSEVAVYDFEFNPKVVRISPSYQNDRNFQHVLAYKQHLLKARPSTEIAFAVRQAPRRFAL